MTFEEFMTKKKIDLPQFKAADPALFLEFQSHFNHMGEKSFDHSKKFLFNKLRRAYHLKEEPKPLIAKERIEINEIASQAEPLISPSVEATVYTPRIRSAADPDTASAEAPKTEKPAYVPRFKVPPAKSPETSPGEEPGTEPTAPAKPAFKPRFKPGLTAAPEKTVTEETKEETPAEKPKPAYVPRFKAPAAPKPVEQAKEEDAADKPKPGYVPRFKPRLTSEPREGTSEEDTPNKT